MTRLLTAVCSLFFLASLAGAQDFEQVNTTSPQILSSKTLVAPVLSGTITGTYTLGGTPTITGATLTSPLLNTPTIASPTFSGTATGTYTLGGSPSLVAAVFSGTFTGTYTFAGAPTIAGPTLSGTVLGTYTLGGTPTILDNVFSVSGSSDSTKKLRFEVDGFTSGQTRVVTFPDANLTFPTISSAGDMLYASVAGLLERLPVGINRSVLKAASSNPEWGPRIDIDAHLATTSGTTATFSIPANVRRVTVALTGVSTNGTSIIMLKLGDAGGAENSGYVGGVSNVTTSAVWGDTGAELNTVSVAAGTYSGQVTLVKSRSGTAEWNVSGLLVRTDSAGSMFMTTGNKILSADLTTVIVTTFNGTDTFDAGAVNVTYE